MLPSPVHLKLYLEITELEWDSVDLQADGNMGPQRFPFGKKRFFETRKLHSCQMNDTANGPGPCKVQADLFLSAWTLQKIHFEVSFFETKLWNLDVNKQ